VHEILFASSQSVYGTVSPAPWSEECPAHPQTPYAFHKFSAEICLEELAKQYPELRICSLRLAGVTGVDPEIAETEAVAKLSLRAVQGEKLSIQCGEQLINRIDAEDAAEGVLRVLRAGPERWPKVVNLGTDTQLSLRDVVECIDQCIRKETGEDVKVKWGAGSPGPVFGLASWKLEALTGWVPRITLEEAISKIVDTQLEGISRG